MEAEAELKSVTLMHAYYALASQKQQQWWMPSEWSMHSEMMHFYWHVHYLAMTSQRDNGREAGNEQ